MTERLATGPARTAQRAVEAYQVARRGSLSPCRFTPSCSEYAHEALGEHGLTRGLALAAWRVLRCNPIGGRGVDLVPPNTRGGTR